MKTRIAIVFSVLLICTGANADRLPKVPSVKSPEAQALVRKMAKLREFWNSSSSCFIKENDIVKRHLALPAKIAKIQRKRDQKRLRRYYQQHLLSRIEQAQSGIPGLGSWARIDSTIETALAWLEANEPKGPVRTPRDVSRFIEAQKSYASRAGDIHDFVTTAYQQMKCYKEPGQQRKQLKTALSDLKWRTAKRAINSKLGTTRRNLIPGKLSDSIHPGDTHLVFR